MSPKDLTLITTHLARSMLYLVVIVATHWLVSPYIAPLILAAIVASIFIRIKPALPLWMTAKKSLYAGIATLATLCIIIVPLLVIAVLLGVEAFNFVQFVQSMLGSDGFVYMIDRLSGVEDRINSILAPMNIQVSVDSIREYVSSSVQVFGSILYGNAMNILSNLAGILINSFFFLFITYFLVRDGEMIIEQIKSLMPFSKSDTQNMVDAVEHVGQTVILGSIISALILGAIMTVVFWMFGFASPLLWGLSIAFLSLIPLLGTWFIYLPSMIYLFFGHSWWMALLFLAVILFIDSFLFYAVIRPKFLDAQTQLYPLAIFLAILGGITVFGPIGIVYGPCIMAVFITFMRHLVLAKSQEEVA